MADASNSHSYSVEKIASMFFRGPLARRITLGTLWACLAITIFLFSTTDMSRYTNKLGPHDTGYHTHTGSGRERNGPRHPPIPNIVHYTNVMATPDRTLRYNFHDFLSIYSASVVLQPDIIYIHFNGTSEQLREAQDPATSDLWTIRVLTQIPNLQVRNQTAPTDANNGVHINDPIHRSDFVRTMVMEEFGGIYLDWDVFILRDFSPLRHAGFANVFGLQKGKYGLNSGIYMAIKHSKLMKLWLDNQHIVFDNGWVTHAVDLITVIAVQLLQIPYEVLILDSRAWTLANTFQAPEAESLFGVHPNTNISEPLIDRTLADRVSLTSDDGERIYLDRDVDVEEWEYPSTASYAIHGFKPRPMIDAYHFTPAILLQRQSIFARAIYPVVKHAVDHGIIKASD